MDRSQKAESVASLNAVFNEVGVVVVTRNLGLTVAQSTQLRTKIREAGASYKVAKNRLAKLAIQNTDYAGIGDLLTGPTAIAASVDPVAAAKVVVEFAKTNDKLEIVGGSMGSDPRRCQGARLDALARRTAREAHRSGPGSGHEDRPALDRSGGQAGPRLRRLRQGSLITTFNDYSRSFAGTIILGVKHHGRYRQAC
jgi:large subunit ribosomal protein L10